MAADRFTREELQSISARAHELATKTRSSGMRTALLLLSEAAANVAVKLPIEEPPSESPDPAGEAKASE